MLFILAFGFAAVSLHYRNKYEINKLN